MDHWWHLIYSKVMISVDICQFYMMFSHFFRPKCSYAVFMATGMHMDERVLIAWFFVPIAKIGKFQQNR